ncbi:MAG: 7-carboxy-7-deazaguanine synthase QueE, partial [Flavobacteriales bacterium]
SNLTYALHSYNIRTHLETSGVHELSGKWDWVCFSPKKFKTPLPSIYEFANELKVVIYNHSDLAWADEHAKKVNSDCELFLQPEWSKREKVTPLIIDKIKNDPKWSISIQTHKYINIP